MDFNQLIVSVKAYLDKFFKEKLSPDLYFHNAIHTSYVVAAAKEIGEKSGLNEEQLQTVILAAWFHDTGYTEVYKGHELVSVEIATRFLAGNGVEKHIIDQVRQCILATRIPQNPTNLMEMVICDADFFHLSVDHYAHFARVLKMEWEHKLDLHYTQQQWDCLNLEMLQTHKYFTAYGQSVLQLRKEINIDILKAAV